MKRLLWFSAGLLIVFLILWPTALLFVIPLGIGGYVIYLITKALRIYIKKKS